MRDYGTAGDPVIVVHGGPGAPGYLAPLARRLAEDFRVLEPFQRGAGPEPLTVARHVEDLHDLIERGCTAKPSLVGHSWGAMLVLAHAAAHPGDARALVLIGCGTFDAAARARWHATTESRIGAALRARLERLPEEFPDPDERLRVRGDLLLPAYSYSLVPAASELEACDARAHEETWRDMLRLQDAGVYPAAFAAIEAPVLMLHGAVDPHPGRMIRDSLLPHLPQLAYQEWERCGHYPWLEREAREDFFRLLCRWLGDAVGGEVR